jgi:hypothetical protein
VHGPDDFTSNPILLLVLSRRYVLKAAIAYDITQSSVSSVIGMRGSSPHEDIERVELRD